LIKDSKSCKVISVIDWFSIFDQSSIVISSFFQTTSIFYQNALTLAYLLNNYAYFYTYTRLEVNKVQYKQARSLCYKSLIINTAFSALMRYKVKSCNACGAGILPARYVPHNIGKCCICTSQ
ncbi:MAG: hypothetical protein ACKPB9_06975, partial [Dolichospermum sp.]